MHTALLQFCPTYTCEFQKLYNIKLSVHNIWWVYLYIIHSLKSKTKLFGSLIALYTNVRICFRILSRIKYIILPNLLVFIFSFTSTWTSLKLKNLSSLLCIHNYSTLRRYYVSSSCRTCSLRVYIIWAYHIYKINIIY